MDSKWILRILLDPRVDFGGPNSNLTDAIPTLEPKDKIVPNMLQSTLKFDMFL